MKRWFYMLDGTYTRLGLFLRNLTEIRLSWPPPDFEQNWIFGWRHLVYVPMRLWPRLIAMLQHGEFIPRGIVFVGGWQSWRSYQRMQEWAVALARKAVAE